jgi:hypothetical protein
LAANLVAQIVVAILAPEDVSSSRLEMRKGETTGPDAGASIRSSPARGDLGIPDAYRRGTSRAGLRAGRARRCSTRDPVSVGASDKGNNECWSLTRRSVEWSAEIRYEVASLQATGVGNVIAAFEGGKGSRNAL